MRIPTCLSLCALALGPAFTVNAEYSWELAGRLGNDEPEQGGDSDHSSASTTYYFDPVEDGTGPHALAAFLDPATRVSLIVSRDKDTLPSGALDDEITNYTVSGQYLLPRSKWFVGGRYSQGDVDEPFSPPVTASSIDLESQAVVAGKYLGAGATRLQLSLDRSKTESEQVLTLCIPGCFTGIASADVTVDEVRLDVMHVAPIRAATYALTGGVSESNADAVGSIFFIPNPLVPPFPNQTFPKLDLGALHTYFVSAELFPIQKLGVRVGFTRMDGDSVDGEVVDVEASWFFRRNVGLELTLSREELQGDDTDGVALRVIGRF